MVFKPRLTELALPMVTCCYMDNAVLAFAWQDNKQLERVTELAICWKQDGSCIQMRLQDPHSAVTSQQQLDRVTGTVQRMMEVELEETEMGLALCELDIECYVASYNPRYIAQALQRLMIQLKMKRKMKDMTRAMLGRMRYLT